MMYTSVEKHFQIEIFWNVEAIILKLELFDILLYEQFTLITYISTT